MSNAAVRTPRPLPRGARAGFTLIELLVVIAIIAILAAILFPVFAQARGKARQAVCLSNQKQIGLAFMQYVEDYDETLPFALQMGVKANGNADWLNTASYFVQTNPSMPGAVYTVNDGQHSGHWISWMDLLYPYIKSTAVFVCPQIQANSNIASYGYNYFLSGIYNAKWGLPGSTTGLPIAQIRVPASTLVTMDWGNVYGLYMNPNDFYSWTQTYNKTYTPVTFPHMEGNNQTFADGHAKWYKRGSQPAYDPALVGSGNPTWAPSSQR